MPVFLAVFLADSNLEKNTCFLGETNLLVPALAAARSTKNCMYIFSVPLHAFVSVTISKVTEANAYLQDVEWDGGAFEWSFY